VEKLLEEDVDYTLTTVSTWITVKDMSIHIVKTDEGVVVDIYALGHEDDQNALLASCYAFDEDAAEAAEECGHEEEHEEEAGPAVTGPGDADE
jgi:arginine repressor